MSRFHGGATRSSREKARERILAAADPAAKTIIDIANDKRAPRLVRLGTTAKNPASQNGSVVGESVVRGGPTGLSRAARSQAHRLLRAIAPDAAPLVEFESA